MIDQYNSLGEKLLKKSFWLYLFSFIIAPIGYIIKIILSNELSISELGIIYGIISFITIISAFNDFGVTESLKYFIPKFLEKKDFKKIKSILIYSFLMQLTTSLLIASIFYFGANFIAENYFKSDLAINSLKIFSLFFIGINIFQIITTFLLSVQNTFYTKLLDFLRFTFSLVFISIITFLNIGNLEIYSWAWIFGLYIGIIFGFFIFFKKYYLKYFRSEKTLWDKKLFKKIFKYAIFVFLGAQAGMILSQIDMQMIIYILGTVDAGYYTVYLSIIGIPFLVATPLFGFLLPLFSELHTKKSKEQIIKLKEILFNSFIIIGIFLSVFFFISSYILSFVLFGESFLKSGEILRYSIPFLVFNFLLQINFSLLAGIGRVKERVKIIGIAIIINFFLNLIFINYLGVSGAALATGIGWIIIYIMSEFRLGKKYIIKLKLYSIIKNLIVFLSLFVLSYIYLLNFSSKLTRISTFILLIFIFIIYFCVFVILNKEVLYNLKNQVKIRK